MARKLSANLPGIHTIPRSIARGGIPLNTKSAFLELFMHENEKSRLTRERERLLTRRKAIRKRLGVINKSMNRLMKSATRGSKLKSGNPGSSEENKSLVLGY